MRKTPTIAMPCTDASGITAVPVIIPDTTTIDAIYFAFGAPTNAPISMTADMPTDKSGKYV
jgi:hypothetical protein